MKDTVHAAVHRSVHLFGEGKFYGALRLRFTRPLILDKGKTPEWAGATPLRCHGKRGARSRPTRRTKESIPAWFCGGSDRGSGVTPHPRCRNTHLLIFRRHERANTEI